MTAYPKRVFPLDDGGSASGHRPPLGPSSGVSIADRTANERFGIKGLGSAECLESAGIPLPEINRSTRYGDALIVRLGKNDIFFLAETDRSTTIETVRSKWDRAAGAKGYSSWREESWAWLVLAGRDLDVVLAALCAVDLREPRLMPDAVTQTRFAGVDAIILRRSRMADILFDISATADVVAEISHHASTMLGGNAP